MATSISKRRSSLLTVANSPILSCEQTGWKGNSWSCLSCCSASQNCLTYDQDSVDNQAITGWRTRGEFHVSFGHVVPELPAVRRLNGTFHVSSFYMRRNKRDGGMMSCFLNCCYVTAVALDKHCSKIKTSHFLVAQQSVSLLQAGSKTASVWRIRRAAVAVHQEIFTEFENSAGQISDWPIRQSCGGTEGDHTCQGEVSSKVE